MHTIELLEQVLASVDTQDAEGMRFLLLCQRVNRAWRDIISRNEDIRRALFLTRPNEAISIARCVANPLVVQADGEQVPLRFADGTRLSISVIANEASRAEYTVYLCGWKHALSIFRSASPSVVKPSFDRMYLASGSYAVRFLEGFYPIQRVHGGPWENPTLLELCEALEKAEDAYKKSREPKWTDRWILPSDPTVGRLGAELIVPDDVQPGETFEKAMMAHIKSLEEKIAL